MFVRVLVVAVVALGLWALLARDSGAGSPSASYRVRPGDTLWSIAVAHHAGDPREGVWELQQLNRLQGATIQPGQVLVLP
jgi:LysM repeat protein